MDSYHIISSRALNVVTIYNIFKTTKLKLSEGSRAEVITCKHLDAKLATNEKPMYGINTGSLYNVRISEKTTLTSKKLVIYTHGTGDRVPESIVKVMLLLKIR
jgi:histidine ammonia-lyase